MNDLKVLRKIKRLSQVELADILDIPTRTLWNWESGARTAPKYLIDLIVQYVLPLTDEEISRMKKYVVVEMSKKTGEIIVFEGDRRECLKYQEEKKAGQGKYENLLHSFVVYNKVKYIEDKKEREALYAYESELTPEEKARTVKLDSTVYPAYMIEFERKYHGL